MADRSDLHPFPNGWYVFALSSELPKGKVLARAFMGQDVTVFRTQSGQAHAVESYCPHLGAHFGHGGTVVGETLQCPFHGFRFNGKGACVRTGYDTPAPPKAKLRTWHLREQNGFLLIYHHVNGEAPDWQVPSVDEQDWTPLIYKSFVLNDHPQETTENSVDVGHFSYVHNYQRPRETRAFEAKGHALSTGYAVLRSLNFLGFSLRRYDLFFDIQIFGLGYSIVNIRLPLFKVVARLWVLPTSIDENRIILRLALRMKKWPTVLGDLASRLMGRYIFYNFVKDASQDFPIWENKRFLRRPALAQGDGPIGKYRHWAKQFYSPTECDAGKSNTELIADTMEM
ncbi:Rieske 2Fe-2S domain-containing protein [candidate division KSB1 bacterium]|nr:Rieske 2Fe-2S domain-containing protein [candidate division KSB1 bacterium]